MKQELTLKSFNTLLTKHRAQIAAALPKHLSPDRLCRIILTEVRRNEKLLDCSQESLFGSIMQATQLGLEIGNQLGQAYLIPYKNECQFIIGYRGMIDLARRSGQIVSLSAHAVYKNDLFEFEYGLEEKLRHIPSSGDRGEFLCAYAIAHLKDGGHQIEVLFKNEIDKIRSLSKAASSQYSPWQTHYEEMAKKTVIRRLFKYLPVSIELQRAIVSDEAAERGEQNNGMIFEGEFEAGEETRSDQKINSLIDKLSDEKPQEVSNENAIA